jgi:acetyl-CoA carboxylase carboxyltransferase component
MKKQGKEIHPEDKKKFLEEIQQRYEEQTKVFYAASRLWIDGIIDPAETREVVSYCINLANHNSVVPKFNPGVIQT